MKIDIYIRAGWKDGRYEYWRSTDRHKTCKEARQAVHEYYGWALANIKCRRSTR
jgi:hypothetical protein